MKDSVTHGALIILILIMLGFFAYVVFVMPSQNDATERTGATAVHQLPPNPAKEPQER